MDPDALYESTEVDQAPPAKARILASVPCGRCGEATMETRIGRFEGRELCPPCFEEAMAAA